MAKKHRSNLFVIVTSLAALALLTAIGIDATGKLAGLCKSARVEIPLGLEEFVGSFEKRTGTAMWEMSRR